MKPLFLLNLTLLTLVAVGGGFAAGLSTGLTFPRAPVHIPQDRLSTDARAFEAPVSTFDEQKIPLTNNPLADHDTYISFSDSTTSMPKGTLVAEGASVPDLLVCHTISPACEAGELLIYFVDAETLTEPNAEDISLVRSSDGGKTWSARQVISVENKPDDLPVVDPSVVQLADGSLRMYVAFFDLRPGSDPLAEHQVLSLVSTDGINFTVEEGVRLSQSRLTDPEVVTGNGKWYLFYSLGQESGLAVSEDGLYFTDQGALDVAIGGVPGAFIEANGDVRVYGCTPEGIASAVSHDGKRFTLDAVSILPSDVRGMCDPSMQAYKDGFAFVYKYAPPPSNTQPLTSPKQ